MTDPSIVENHAAAARDADLLAPFPIPLGQRARQIFHCYIRRGSLRSPFAARLYFAVARPAMFLIRTAWCLHKFGPEIAAAGRSLPAQAGDMLWLGWCARVDPILYPMLELYRPDRRDWPAYLLSRFEVGHGLMKRLHKLRPKPHGARVNLGDKLAFHACARAHNLPSPSILIHASGGELCWLEAAGASALDRDLFIKPRQSRGARNALWLRRIAPFTWSTQHGAVWTRRELFNHLKRKSRRQDFLLQAMLNNDDDIADLADQSLIAIRVFTAMNGAGQPTITHAMLRVLAKLEPRWHSKREYAAAIDLRTGRLGQMCNDKDLRPGRWTNRHPVTQAPVNGRRLAAWPAIADLAIAAHKVFADRMVVGWDIAVAPAGPIVLEGNSYADVHFLQRVHRQPIGLSALGPLLQNALDRLEVSDRDLI